MAGACDVGNNACTQLSAVHRNYSQVLLHRYTGNRLHWKQTLFGGTSLAWHVMQDVRLEGLAVPHTTHSSLSVRRTLACGWCWGGRGLSHTRQNGVFSGTLALQYTHVPIYDIYTRQWTKLYSNSASNLRLHVSQAVVTLRTSPGSGGGMRVCGSAGTAWPQSVQNLAYGSDGLVAKQLMHLPHNNLTQSVSS